MNAKVNERQAFCEKHFQFRAHNVRWFDIVGITSIDDSRRARIELVEIGTRGHYEGLEVRIVSKTGGTIESKVFPFIDYVKTANAVEPCISAYVGWQWFCCSTPPNTDALIKAVDDYIASWQ